MIIDDLGDWFITMAGSDYRWRLIDDVWWVGGG